jgi:hypothetical protein
MLSVRLDVTLTLNGPVLTRATAMGAYGVDAPMARGSGRLYALPGTLVKGRLLDAWRELHDLAGSAFTPDIVDLLGEEAGNPERDVLTVRPRRGRLHFEEFPCDRADTDRTLFRIQIDPDRGAVRKGAYQVVEAPFGPGESVSFRGVIRFSAKDAQEARTIRDQVDTGLRWITSLGAVRTSGFGRLLDVSVSDRSTEAAAIATVSTATGAEAFDVELELLAPFCVSRHRADENLFESETVIPGGVLKGALAAGWQGLLGQDPNGEIGEPTDPSRPELGRWFHRIRFTHAFPARADQPKRPVVPPLSLVKAGDRRYDVALGDGPALVDGRSPAFAIDWKARDDVDRDFGWAPAPRRELRVRTAIDADTRRGAEGKLFAYEMVVPDGFVWRARIDLGLVPPNDRPRVEEQLRQVLAHGLHGIGKTKASADVRWPEAPVVPHVASHGTEAPPWVLTLQAPALLVSLDGLDETSGAAELQARYRAAFDELSDHSLRLVRSFATERLAGGFYLHRRFAPGQPYRPYLLTEEGSVFVLEPAAPDRAKDGGEHIRSWTLHGLPPPEWVGPEDGSAWRTCPYIRENGYGEVAVNLCAHRTEAPPHDILTPIPLLEEK